MMIRNQTKKPGLAFELDYRHGVLRAVADKKFFAGPSNASASGCAPNKSPGFCRAQIVSTILSSRVSMTLNVSLPVLAATT